MSYGKMNERVLIISTTQTKDSEGFAFIGKHILASVRAYKEDRYGNTAWKNRAAFSTATALFRFRVIPGVTVTTAMLILCGSDYYKILSVEDLRGRGMYLEILTEKVIPSGKM